MNSSLGATGNLDSADLCLEWTEAPWDSILFGFPVLQIARIEVRNKAAERDFAIFEAVRDRLKTGLVSCRLSHQSLRESMFLEARGFRFIEMVYHPEIDDLQTKGLAPSGGLEVSLATTADLHAIQEIAGHAFRNERFHVDPRLDSAIGDQRYKNWASSSFNHSSQKLFCIRNDQRVVAFFITEMLPDDTCYWHLNAVAPDAQGNGYGWLAWRTMMHQAQLAGAKMIRTCVVARNYRVLNLYGRLGFRLLSPEMTLHWVREELGA